MKPVLTGLLALAVSTAWGASPDQAGLKLNFDPDWKFIKADPAGAAQPDFKDAGWQAVSLPHTFNDTDTFDDWSLPGHRGEQNQWSGRTWYRKTFALPEAFRGKKIYLEFEGARQVAEVYLNGRLLGVSKTGFIPFGFDLTPQLRFGAPNVLAVMCDNRFMKDPPPAAGKTTGDNTSGHDLNFAPPPGRALAEFSARVNAAIPEDVDQIQADQIPWNNPHWHPAHGGIYRNVWLHVLDPLHISLPLYSFLHTAGPYVYTTEVSARSATVNLEVPVENARKSAQKITLAARVLDRGGNPVLTVNQAGEIAAGTNSIFKLSGRLANPQLWEPGYPYLYRVVCSVLVDGKAVDTQEIPLGIRTVRWDAKTGFFINGHHVKLHGWGQKPTDEWPGLGAALPDWLHYYTLELMKVAGGNWVRWGHCAAGPGLIAAGDELGIMAEQPGVDGESDTRGAAWKIRAAAFRDMLIYYRNHPSILIWEGGNQKVTREHARELRGYMDLYDSHGGRAYAHRRADQATGESMDVCIGTEGGREIKTLPVVEGEYDREESPRRVWDDCSPPNFGYPEAAGQTYQLTSEQYAVNEITHYLRKIGAASHCGGANWIFSDSTSGGRVACEVARASGEVDGVRLPKEAYYVCQTLFRDDPQVHIIGHWNYAAGTNKTIYVAANGDAVELFVNGRSLGRGRRTNPYLFVFPGVAWEAGEIRAVASRGGIPVATDRKQTAGAPAALRLTPITAPGGWRADGSDIALVDVEAVDAEGRRCPTVQQRVDFELGGPAVWRGGYNSGKTNSINNTYLDLECGINRVSLRATRQSGPVILHARSAGLKEAILSLPLAPANITNGWSAEPPAVPVPILPAKPAGENETSVAAATETRAAGRFINLFSYSGPTAGVHVEAGAHDGLMAFGDCPSAISNLPPELQGADYVQAAGTDRFYSALDLMEVGVGTNATLFVAFDRRLPQPGWLQQQFRAVNLAVTVNTNVMDLFARPLRAGESVTLGSNCEDSRKAGNMYVVFVQAGGKHP